MPVLICLRAILGQSLMDYHRLPTWPRMTKKDQLACRKVGIQPPPQLSRYIWFKRALRCRRLDSNIQKRTYENTSRRSIWLSIPRCMNDWLDLRQCSNSNLISAKNSWRNIRRGSQLALTCLKEFLRDVWPDHLVSRFNSERKHWRPRTADTAITNLWIRNHSTALADFVVFRKKLWLTWFTTVPAIDLAKPKKILKSCCTKSKKDIPVGPYEILRRSDETSLIHIQNESLALFVDSLEIQRLFCTAPWVLHELIKEWKHRDEVEMPLEVFQDTSEALLPQAPTPTAESTAKSDWKHSRNPCCPEI